MAFDGLLFASRALQVQASALDVTGQNLSGMNSPGYTRQRVVPNVGPGIPLPDQPLPTVGPTSPFPADGVERIRDTFLDGAIRGQNATVASAQASQTVFERANTFFDETSTPGLNANLSSFLSSVQQASLNPQDVGLRQTVLDQANTLASTFAQRAQNLIDLRTEVGGRENQAVASANSILQQLAQLNGAIPGPATTDSNAVLDQRDLLVDKLSQIMDVQAVPQPQGDLVVYAGGVPLVFGKTARTVRIDQDSSGADVVKTDNNKTLSPPGSELGALLDARNTGLPALQSQLDSLATSVITQVNTRLANSSDLNGNPGAPLFSGTSAVTMQAALQNPRALGFATASLQSAAGVNSAGQTVDPSQSLASQAANLATAPAASGTITVNGVAVNWTNAESINQIVAAFPPGVTARFDAASQSVVLSRDPAAGSGPGITVSDTTGNLAAVFNLTTAVASNGVPGDGGGAASIANLVQVSVVGTPPSQTLSQGIQSLATGVASQAASYQDAYTSANKLQQALTAQKESVSGVNSDEEAVNLMQFQRGYEAAIKLANAQDSLLQTLISSIGGTVTTG